MWREKSENIAETDNVFATSFILFAMIPEVLILNDLLFRPS